MSQMENNQNFVCITPQKDFSIKIKSAYNGALLNHKEE
jgi:hypothetical protein